MADLTKTVSIIFLGDSAEAQKEIAAVSQGLDNLGTSADPGKLTPVSEAIKEVGDSSKVGAEQAATLGAGLKKLAEDAGAPKEALEGIDSLMLRLGKSGTGSIVVAAAAIAAFGIVAGDAGSEAFQFKTKLDNLTGGTTNAAEAFKDVQQAARELEIDLGQLADLYSGYLAKIENTAISGQIAESAFIGISAAIKGQGGDLQDTEKALDKFIDATKDGTVDLKELESKITEIPGGLRIFAEALGVPVEDLKLLAENGKLGREEIALFAEAMRNQEYGSLTPVKDAFVDLYNTLKTIALDVGAEGFVTGAFFVLEKAIRGITLAAVGTQAFVVALGETLANIAFTISSLDFSGFAGRQQEVFDNFGTRVDAAKSKLLGLEAAVKSDSAKAAGTDYKAMADGIREAGDKAEPTAEKIKRVKDETEKGGEASKQYALSAKLAAQADESRAKALAKTEEAALKSRVELEKIASNERIKFIEATVKLDIAKLEADVKKFEAVFASIDNTINSTGDLLSSLFGNLKDSDSMSWDSLRKIDDQIEKENKIREAAFTLQKAMTETQIEYMRAQIQAMRNGDGFIKIDGAGLAPHLEAFMWEILKTIQVRVNKDGLKMLLGT
ncbi:MAG: tape measure protein [Hydrogenophaga sp.]|nr:tape measure protein [Hydrogenophaga sp.]